MKKKLLLIITLLAIVMTFIGVQKPFIHPFPFGLKTDKIHSYTSSPNFSVAIDAEERRMLFLNSKGELVNILFKNTLSTTEYFYDTLPAIDGDFVWFMECESEPNDIFISAERLVRYTSGGKFSGTIWEKRYDFAKTEDYHYSSPVWKLEVNGEKGLAYYFTHNDSDKVIEFNPYKTGTGNVRNLQKMENIEYKSLDDIYIPFSKAFAISNILFWLSAAYLLLLLSFFIIRYLHGLVCSKEFATLKRIGIRVGYVAVVTVMVLFYSHALNSFSMEKEKDSLMLSATELRNKLDNLAGLAINEYLANRTIDEDTKSKLIAILDDSAITARKSGYSFLPILYANTPDGRSFSLASALEEVITGFELNANLKSVKESTLKNLNKSTIINYKNFYSKSLGAVAPYESLNGGILILDDYFSLMNEQMIRNFTLIVIVISISLAISSLISELKSCIGKFKLFFRNRRENTLNPEFHLVRPIYFAAYSALAAIFMMGTLIGGDIISASPYADSSFVMSLPLTLLYAGAIAAFIIYGFISRKMGQKPIVLTASIIAQFSYAALAVATAKSDLFLYLLFIFTSVTATMICISYVFSLILLAPDNPSMNDANESRVSAELSASIIVGISSGFIAQYIGNCWTYVLSMFFILIAIVLIVCLVSRDDKSTASDCTEKVENRRLLKFMLSPGMIMIFICTVIPYCISYTYTDFLFPILASQKGLDKSIIATIDVLAIAFTSYATPSVNRKFYEIGFKRSAFFIAILSALFYVMFILNDSLFMLIVFMPIFYTLSANGEVIPNMIWPIMADKAKIPRDDVNGSFLITDQACRILSTPCVGALLGLGQALMFGIMSAYMFISGCAYRISCRREDK